MSDVKNPKACFRNAAACCLNAKICFRNAAACCLNAKACFRNAAAHFMNAKPCSRNAKPCLWERLASPDNSPYFSAIVFLCI